MNKQTIAVVVGALVLFAVAVIGALAFTGSDSGADNMHTMQNGDTMTGTMTRQMHTMDDGVQMPGMTHTSP